MFNNVLLVGGSSLAGRLYRAILDPLHCRVTQAQSIHEASQALSHFRRLDLVIVDASMPGELDLEALRALSARRGTSAAPTLVVAAGTVADDAPGFADSPGSFTFVKKPIRVDAFTVLVRQLLRAPPEGRRGDAEAGSDDDGLFHVGAIRPAWHAPPDDARL